MNREIIPNVVHFNILLGKIRSGKSVLLQNLYLSNRFYGKDFDIKILISPSAHNDVMLKHMTDNFTFVFDSYSEDLLQEIIDMIQSDETNARYSFPPGLLNLGHWYENDKMTKKNLFNEPSVLQILDFAKKRFF